ncbi:capsular biosynthesis protein, partial [Campylobacter coli]|nr:capsular biosynthesis protein [Campylobacter coli]EGV0042836.1 capsular biosynthesis protein [Campylobacter coli]
EFYIAPMYNYLINQNKDIRYHEIDINDIIFCGTPQEYERLIL